MYRQRQFALLAIAIVASACGGGGGGGGGGKTPSPPTISNLAFSPSSAPQGGGTVDVNGTIDFTDSGGDLASLEITVLDPAGTKISSSSTPLQGASNLTSGQISGTIRVAVGSPGRFTFNVSVTDSGGSKSNVLTGDFQVTAIASQAALITPTAAGVQSLITADGKLYWFESGEDALKSVPVGGGTTSVLAAKMRNPVSVAFSGSDVIWLEERACARLPQDDRVVKRMLTSGAIQVLATGSACGSGTTDIAAIGTDVYWVSQPGGAGSWQINVASLIGAAATTLRTTNAPIVALTSNGGTLYWMEQGPVTGTQGGIYSTVPGSGYVATVASGFASDLSTFAVDNSAVYYLSRNVGDSTEALWAQPLAAGAAQNLAAAIQPPIKILSTASLSGNSLIWVDAGAVHAMSIGGGPVAQLAATSGAPMDVLFDGANVLWTEVTGAGHGESGSIRSVPLSGGVVSTLHQGGDAPRRLARDLSGRVVWTEGGPIGAVEGFARIARIGLTGSEETVATGVTGDTVRLIVGPTSLLIADGWRIKSVPLAGGMPHTLVVGNGGTIGGVATDGSSVYWDDSTSGVTKAPLAGGPVTVLVGSATARPGIAGPLHLAPTGDLYWSVTDAFSDPAYPLASVFRTPSGVATDAATVVASVSGFSDIAVDGTGVYIAEISAGQSKIEKVPLNGGSSSTVVTEYEPVGYVQVGIHQLTLDGASLYWWDQGLDHGSIDRLPTGGGTAVPVVTFDAGNSSSFALDSTSLYFSDSLAIKEVGK